MDMKTCPGERFPKKTGESGHWKAALKKWLCWPNNAYRKFIINQKSGVKVVERFDMEPRMKEKVPHIFTLRFPWFQVVIEQTPVVVTVSFGYLCGDHHFLWGECHTLDCVMCDWSRKKHLDLLLQRKPCNMDMQILNRKPSTWATVPFLDEAFVVHSSSIASFFETKSRLFPLDKLAF